MTNYIREFFGAANMAKDTIPFSVGGAGLTFPLWFDAVAAGWQFLVALVGGLVVMATLYRVCLEIKIKRRDLSK